MMQVLQWNQSCEASQAQTTRDGITYFLTLKHGASETLVEKYSRTDQPPFEAIMLPNDEAYRLAAGA